MNSTSSSSHSSTPFRFQSLASGSSGNAYILEVGDDLLLIDCGIGIRLIQAGLMRWGKSIADVSALVITHEHSDHVRALASFLRYQTRIYATCGTAGALGLSRDRFQPLRYTQPVALTGISITPIRTSHDAAEPCGMMIEAGDRTIGLVTDLGTTSDDIAACARRCDLLILESNHDREMLRSGPYPAYLKRRVASDVGHLSNDQAGGFLSEVSTVASGPSEVWLAHLSGTNNTPAVAKSSVVARLKQSTATPLVNVLPRGVPGPVWNGANIRARQLQLMVEEA